MKFVAALAAVLLLSPLASRAQNPPATPAPQKSAPVVQHEANFDAERAQADQLYLARKPIEALPLYEDLCRQDPTIAVFAERHAGGLLAKMATVDDPKQKQAILAEAIKELNRAESLGDNSPWVEGLLGSLAKTPIGVITAGPTGGLPLTVGYIYGGTPQAQALEQQGESAFGHNDLPSALKFYLAAGAADPTWYMPALYSGDVYYRLKDVNNAGICFAKAIAIDPDRETAYRYWGDALMHAGDNGGARVKFEQGIAAEPYGRSAFNGLRQWALMTHVSIVAPQVLRPDFSKPADADLATESGDGHNSWLVYKQTRLAHDPHVIFNQWIMAGSTPATPQLNFVPSGYVHTLAEEVDAITAMLADVKKKLASGAVTQEKLEPGIKNLLVLEKDNMLEPFILLSFNDAGIRHGYPEYRAAHRDRVVQYIDRYMIGPPTNTPNPYVQVNP
jgi:tetratricopeptide (TPR) repeat protein